MSEPLKMRIGPLRREWPHETPPGDCVECGGDCDGDDCGLHAAGCFYGGFTAGSSYWMIVDGCPRWHGDAAGGTLE